MPETDRLGYAHGILEELRASHGHLSREELLDLVCHLTKTYVLDQTIPFDIPLPERAEEMRGDRPHVPPNEVQENDSEDPPERRFARLIEGLKQRTKLPQFDQFSVEGDKAVLIVDNQKVTFGERVTVEFVPGRPTARSRTPVEARPRPSGVAPAGEPTREGPTAGPTPAPRPAPRPPPSLQDDDDDDDGGYDASVERFKRLDLD